MTISKPIFPEGVEVRSPQLKGLVSALDYHIQQRQIDVAASGRVEGLIIGVSGFLVSVTAGRGWTPRGDRIVLSADSANIRLSDYTDGVKNLICAIYSESKSIYLAHETGSSQQATLRNDAVEIVCLTEEEYLLLPESTDSDLEVDLATTTYTQRAKNRILVLGTVLGNGFVSGTTPNPLVLGEVVQADLDALEILTASCDLAGVNIKALSDTTNQGTGILRIFNDSGTIKIGWFAPPAASSTGDLGVAEGTVALASAATIDMSDASAQVFDISSDEPGTETTSTITVEVFTTLLSSDPADLASSNGNSSSDSIEATVAVSVLYDEYGAAFSARDRQHRGSVGSYIPRPDLPHGTGIQDLSGQNVLNIGRPVVLGSDLLGSATEALIARMTVPVYDGASTAYTLITEIAGEFPTRIYGTPNSVNDNRIDIVTNAYWNGTQWVIDSGSEARRVSIQYNVGVAYLYYEGASPFTNADWVETATFDGVGSSILALGTEAIGSTSQRIKSRLSTPHDGATSSDRVLLWKTVGPTKGTYFFAYDGALEIVQNATWDGTNWTQEDATYSSTKIQLNQTSESIFVYTKVAGSPAWGDGTWTLTTSLAPPTGNLSTDGFILSENTVYANDDIIADADGDANGEFKYGSSRTYFRNFSFFDAAVDRDSGAFPVTDVYPSSAGFPTASPGVVLHVATSGSGKALLFSSLVGIPDGAVITDVRLVYRVTSSSSDAGENDVEVYFIKGTTSGETNLFSHTHDWVGATAGQTQYTLTQNVTPCPIEYSTAGHSSAIAPAWYYMKIRVGEDIAGDFYYWAVSYTMDDGLKF